MGYLWSCTMNNPHSVSFICIFIVARWIQISELEKIPAIKFWERTWWHPLPAFRHSIHLFSKHTEHLVCVFQTQLHTHRTWTLLGPGQGRCSCCPPRIYGEVRCQDGTSGKEFITVCVWQALEMSERNRGKELIYLIQKWHPNGILRNKSVLARHRAGMR